ncbi:MAG: TIGR04219 family outer membrane beta-barrel protein [Cellvibrionaceae bacterium]
MKKLIKPLCAASMLIASPVALSDTILGIYTGGGVWNTDFSGNVGDVGQPSADLEDLGLSDQDNNFLFIALEHPIPIIPNIRLQSTDISQSETGTITQSFVLDGDPYFFSQEVTSDFDLSHVDATLYYELLDNWVNLDLGVTFRMFDGEISMQSQTASGSRKLDETIPMLYGKAQFNLPLSGFYVAGGGNYVSYSGSDVSDLQASIGYMSDGLVLDFGIELGIRTFSIELDDVSDLDADMKLDGTFASVYLHF